MKELMLGNKAIARGLYEAGVCFVSSYPGTPSTEITEEAENGHRMKKLQWNQHLAQVWQDAAPFAPKNTSA